jgi:hypothetical protein
MSTVINEIVICVKIKHDLILAKCNRNAMHDIALKFVFYIKHPKETLDMKKLLQLIATSLLVSAVSLPLQAETAKPAVLSKAAKAVSESSTYNLAKKTVSESSIYSLVKTLLSEDTLRFTLQHRFNGGDPLPIETIEIPLKNIKENPLVFFRTIKENFYKHLEKREKPVQIDTELEFLLSAEATQLLGKLPTLSIKSHKDKDGTAKSDVVFPAFQREGLIDWKGLTAQFTLTENLKSLTVNFAGLLVEDQKLSASLSLGKTSFSGEFNANKTPTKIDLSLPRLQVRKKAYLLNLHDLSAKLNTSQSSKEVKLGHLNFKVGHLDVSKDKSKYSFDGLAVTADGEEAQGGVINYTLQTQIDTMTLKDISGVSFVENWAFRNLDEEALSELQTTARQNRSQIKNPKTFVLTMLGKLKEVLPKLSAKSPELALTELNMKNPNGNLVQGNASVSLNGETLKSALQAQAAFSIGKGVIKRILTKVTLRTMLKDFANEQLSEKDLAFLKEQAEAASEQQISMFVGLKWLVDTGDGNYKFVAAFKDNKLNVNGVEMPLPKL